MVENMKSSGYYGFRTAVIRVLLSQQNIYTFFPPNCFLNFYAFHVWKTVPLIPYFSRLSTEPSPFKSARDFVKTHAFILIVLVKQDTCDILPSNLPKYKIRKQLPEYLLLNWPDQIPKNTDHLTET